MRTKYNYILYLNYFRFDDRNYTYFICVELNKFVFIWHIVCAKWHMEGQEKTITNDPEEPNKASWRDSKNQNFYFSGQHKQKKT